MNAKHDSSDPRSSGPRGSGPGHGKQLVLIGGHEDKTGERRILREVVGRVGARPIVVTTIASEVAGELWADYEKVFRELGAPTVVHLEVERREDAYDPARVALVSGAGCVFFTGGDQIRITSRLGGTPLGCAIEALFRGGGIVVGTSAGAAVMSEVMIVGGSGDESPRVRSAIQMAPGLGLLSRFIVDQHFAQRGRIGRLLAALAHNPRLLGIGIDEDTAAVIHGGERLEVIGSGAVTVVDGRDIQHTNLDEADAEQVLSLFDVRLHLLCEGDALDLLTGSPTRSLRRAHEGSSCAREASAVVPKASAARRQGEETPVHRMAAAPGRTAHERGARSAFRTHRD
jgi:cyanophycinase